MSQNINKEKISNNHKKEIDILADIYFHAVFSEKLNFENLERVKSFGIYSQDESQDFFQMKLPLSMGQLNLEQIKVISLISKDYSNGFINFESEQKILFKDIKLHNIPNIFNLLKSVDLNTFFESGYTVRRVLTCPVNGIDKTQLFDVSELANKLNKTFIGNDNYSNLPNKLQFAISGYEEGCNTEFLPDVSFNATKNSKDKIVFAVIILGKVIAYVSKSQVLNTAKSIINIYKDFAYKEDSNKSSFSYFVNNLGFDDFFHLLSSSLNYKIQRSIFIKSDFIARKPRIGIHQSKIEDQDYIACKTENPNIKSSSFESLYSLLKKYDASKIKITHKSNIIILDVPSKNSNNLAKELCKIGFNAF